MAKPKPYTSDIMKKIVSQLKAKNKAQKDMQNEIDALMKHVPNKSQHLNVEEKIND